MTYKELYEKAVYKLEHNEITLGEFNKMIAPLNQEVREWIPITPETLPKEGKMVLVQARELYYNMGDNTGIVRGFHHGGHWSTYTISGHDRIRYAEAWMPLPEPYREKE